MRRPAEALSTDRRGRCWASVHEPHSQEDGGYQQGPRHLCPLQPHVKGRVHSRGSIHSHRGPVCVCYVMFPTHTHTHPHPHTHTHTQVCLRLGEPVRQRTTHTTGRLCQDLSPGPGYQPLLPPPPNAPRAPSPAPRAPRPSSKVPSILSFIINVLFKCTRLLTFESWCL